MLFYIIFSLLLNQLNYSDNQGGNIDITVTGVNSQKGEIMVALFDSPDGFPQNAVKAIKFVKSLSIEWLTLLYYIQLRIVLLKEKQIMQPYLSYGIILRNCSAQNNKVVVFDKQQGKILHILCSRLKEIMNYFLGVTLCINLLFMSQKNYCFSKNFFYAACLLC